MNIGQLRHRIFIELLASTGDDYGASVSTWTSNISAWASINPVRGNEYFSAMQSQAAVTHKITMRYRTLAGTTCIGPGYCRIKFGSRTFDIRSVINPGERNVSLEMMCSEKV